MAALFTLLQDRLIVHLRNRVRTGEITERSLAKLTGLSQPHLHNALKGIRTLSPEYADRIVEQLDLAVSDLLTAEEIGISSVTGEGEPPVPIVKLEELNNIGPIKYMHFYRMPRALTEFLVRPILVKLTHDANVYPHFQEGDLALIDRAPVTPQVLLATAAYLVQTPGGTLVRLVRTGGTRLYLVTPNAIEEPRKWESVPLSGQGVGQAIRGRLVWIGRELGRGPYAGQNFAETGVSSDSR